MRQRIQTRPQSQEGSALWMGSALQGYHIPSGVLPPVKLHTGYERWIQTWSLQSKLQKQNRVDRRNVNPLCEFKLGPMMVLRPHPSNPLHCAVAAKRLHLNPSTPKG
jgi:hypothetical protein